MVPFSSAFSSSASVQQGNLTPISTTSTTGAGSKVDVKVIQNMFTSLKILGLTTLRVILQGKLFSEQYQQDATEIAIDINNTISRLGFTPDMVNMNWLHRLNEEGVTKLLMILQGVEDNKQSIVGVFNKGLGWKARKAEIEIITLVEPSGWHAPHQLTITARDGCFYLKQHGLVYDTNSTLITRKELLVLFKEALNGVNLWLQDQCETDSTFEFDGNWDNLLSDILSEAKMPNRPFNRYIRGPSSLNCKSIKICKEIIANSTKITDRDLVHVLALTKIGKNIKPMFLLPLDLIDTENLTIDAIRDIWTKLVDDHYGLRNEECHELKVMEKWINQVILPPLMANADKFVWLEKLRHIEELIYLLKYTVALNNIHELIDKNRYFAIQLLCIIGKGIPNKTIFNQVSLRQFLLNFYAKHAQRFFEICFLDQLNPDWATSTINSSTVTAHNFDFEKLLPELRDQVEVVLSATDQVNLSSTNKYFRQRREIFYDKKLETDKNKTTRLMSTRFMNAHLMNACIMDVCKKFKKNNELELAFWDVGGRAFPKYSACTSAATFMTYPQYRKPEYLGCDLLGLQFLVYGIEVMGPLTIQKIEKEELTLWDAASARLSLENTLTTLNVSWKEFDILEKYRLDGLLTEETLSRMTEQGRRNLASPALTELINFRALSLERALELNDKEVRRIARTDLHARLSYVIGVERCLVLTRSEHHYLLSPLISPLLIDKQLTLRAALFLFHLIGKFEAGGWQVLHSLIRPGNFS
jgi:hypothetical protein